mgnify:CR=1 FL=1
MQLTQLTDSQLTARLDYFAEIFLASSAHDYDFPELEAQMDELYAEARSRGLMNLDDA